jgi:hypothetical protein
MAQICPWRVKLGSYSVNVFSNASNSKELNKSSKSQNMKVVDESTTYNFYKGRHMFRATVGA